MMATCANTAGLADSLADVVNVIIIQLQKIAGVSQLLVIGEQVRCVVVETKNVLVVFYRQVFIGGGLTAGP